MFEISAVAASNINRARLAEIDRLERIHRQDPAAVVIGPLREDEYQQRCWQAHPSKLNAGQEC